MLEWAAVRTAVREINLPNGVTGRGPEYPPVRPPERDLYEAPFLGDKCIVYMTQKRILALLAQAVQNDARPFWTTAATRMNVPYEAPMFDYKAINHIAYSTRQRSFIFRLYSGIVPASYEKATHFKMDIDADCKWCGEEFQRWTHLLFDCPPVCVFRDQVAARLGLPQVAAQDWLIGRSDDLEEAKATDIIVTALAQNIHWCLNHSTQPPTLEGLLEWVRNIMDSEYVIAEHNSKIQNHLRKWEWLRPKLF